MVKPSIPSITPEIQALIDKSTAAALAAYKKELHEPKGGKPKGSKRKHETVDSDDESVSKKSCGDGGAKSVHEIFVNRISNQLRKLYGYTNKIKRWVEHERNLEKHSIRYEGPRTITEQQASIVKRMIEHSFASHETRVSLYSSPYDMETGTFMAAKRTTVLEKTRPLNLGYVGLSDGAEDESVPCDVRRAHEDAHCSNIVLEYVKRMVPHTGHVLVLLNTQALALFHQDVYKHFDAKFINAHFESWTTSLDISRIDSVLQSSHTAKIVLANYNQLDQLVKTRRECTTLPLLAHFVCAVLNQPQESILKYLLNTPTYKFEMIWYMNSTIELGGIIKTYPELLIPDNLASNTCDKLIARMRNTEAEESESSDSDSNESGEDEKSEKSEQGEESEVEEEEDEVEVNPQSPVCPKTPVVEEDSDEEEEEEVAAPAL